MAAEKEKEKKKSKQSRETQPSVDEQKLMMEIQRKLAGNNKVTGQQNNINSYNNSYHNSHNNFTPGGSGHNATMNVNHTSGQSNNNNNHHHSHMHNNNTHSNHHSSSTLGPSAAKRAPPPQYMTPTMAYHTKIVKPSVPNGKQGDHNTTTPQMLSTHLLTLHIYVINKPFNQTHFLLFRLFSS